MHIHILGVCGTFMGSLAQLAVALGYKVTGADANVYPPMSDQLQQAGIELIEGFSADQLALQPDLFVIGNVISRGNPLMEAILNAGAAYTSGPQWLCDHVLQNRWTLAVAGTHGKTTTASLLAWILEYAGMAPGYLIGGVPGNFPTSARLGDSDFFVIEADEYDTAFFDKRSKFVHYRPNTLILNNLEFDHADIFPDLAAIQRQFHHLLRTVPGNGLVVHPAADPQLRQVLDQGCWSEQQTFGIGAGDWCATTESSDGSAFSVEFQQQVHRVNWSLTGMHNVSNALAAMAAARHVGVVPEVSAAALAEFSGVKRRMELVGQVGRFSLYDDFAHHPTAIQTTLAGLRARVGDAQVIAVLEPRSNTMKLGVHRQYLLPSVADADVSLWLQPDNLGWSLAEAVAEDGTSLVFESTGAIIDALQKLLRLSPGRECHIVVMSNGSFAGIHQQIFQHLKNME